MFHHDDEDFSENAALEDTEPASQELLLRINPGLLNSIASIAEDDLTNIIGLY